MKIDTRTGAAPLPGHAYRMETHDRLFGSDLDYVFVTGFSAKSPATGNDDQTFWFRYLTSHSFGGGGLVSANLCGGRMHLRGPDWYRVFTRVPPITSPGGTGLL